MSRSENRFNACQAATLSAGGIVTAAALSCLVEVDLQVRAVCPYSIQHCHVRD